MVAEPILRKQLDAKQPSKEGFCSWLRRKCTWQVLRKFLQSPPHDWLMEKSLASWAVALLGINFMCITYVPFLFLTGTEIGTILTLLASVVIFSAATSVTTFCCLSSSMKEGALLIVALAMHATLLSVILHTKNDVEQIRIRLMCTLGLVFKFLPILGSSNKGMLFYVTLNLCLELAGCAFGAAMHGDFFGLGYVVHLIEVTLLYITILLQSAHRTKTLYTSEAEFSSEQGALNAFMTHLCDAFVRVSSDCRTIKSSDDNFKDYVAGDVTGLAVETLLTDSPSTQETLASAFESANATIPVQVPCKLRPMRHDGDDHNVTVMIVRKKRAGFDLEPEFLLAIRFYDEYNRVPLPREGEDSFSLSHIRQSPAAINSDTDSVPASSAVFLAAKERNFSELLQLGKRERWLVHQTEFDFDSTLVLGTGSFGKVVQGSFHGSPVAVKFGNDEKKSTSLLVELRLLRHLRHPNIVLFHGACIEDLRTWVALLFELVEGPTLRLFIKDLSFAQYRSTFGKVDIIIGMGRALQYLHEHSPQIIHGDLKASNIFVEIWKTSLRAKLGDFGLSRRVHKDPKMGGTLRWAAPEIFSGKLKAPEPSTDIFSLGRLINFVVTERLPFHTMTDQEIKAMVHHGCTETLTWPDDSKLGTICSKLAEACAAITPKSRPTIADVNKEISTWKSRLKMYEVPPPPGPPLPQQPQDPSSNCLPSMDFPSKATVQRFDTEGLVSTPLEKQRAASSSQATYRQHLSGHPLLSAALSSSNIAAFHTPVAAPSNSQVPPAIYGCNPEDDQELR